MSKGKVILVGGSKGGPGKSTLAQQIAGCLSLVKNKSVHVLDIDIKQLTTYTWCEERAMNDEVPTFGFSVPDVKVQISAMIDKLRKDVDFVVVDAGGFDSDAQREAMLEADYILLPLRPKRRDIRSLPNLDEIMSMLREVNTSVHIRTVINQCPTLPSMASYILSAKSAASSFELEPLDSIVCTRTVYDAAEEDGRTIYEVSDRDRKAEAEINNLVDELIFGVKPQ